MLCNVFSNSSIKKLFWGVIEFVLYDIVLKMVLVKGMCVLNMVDI